MMLVPNIDCTKLVFLLFTQREYESEYKEHSWLDTLHYSVFAFTLASVNAH